jgi:universal stress protein A
MVTIVITKPLGMMNMSNYKRILVAIDSDADYESVIQKALTVCQSMDDVSLVHIRLSSVYIQPYLYAADYSEIDAADRIARAQNRMFLPFVCMMKNN